MSEAVAAAEAAKPSRKQQQRSLVTQHKLLDAATEAFSENGFKGTSTRDIAERAGVHHPLITYHFKNKDQLWRAATDQIFREFNISLVKAMAEVSEADPRARAEAFVRTYVRYAYQRPALHKIILQESSKPSDRLDWLVENHLRPLFDEVVKSLEVLQEMGIAPAGQQLEMTSLDIWRCENGLIRENWVMIDLLDIWQQVGVDVLERMREMTFARQPLDFKS